ncbi:MAG TPA: PAS domain S-box protein [Burkholderiaceae bacterium]|nr:PAS domain S-box protein [Burkholderiaceae bacterium]
MNQPTSDATDASLNTGEGMADLRRRAEAQLVGRLRGRLDKIEAADVEWLVHELGVHQVELEAQNEQLLQVQAALEASRDRYVALYEEAPVGYVTTGLDGGIVEANHLGAQMMGLSLPNLLGRRLVDHFAGVDRLRYRKACQQLLLDTAPATVDLQLVPTRGTPVRVTARIAVVKDEPEQVRRYRVALVDVTERAHLQDQRAHLAAIVESSDDAIIGRDLEGRILTWNSGATRLLGFNANQMIGQRIDLVIPAERRLEDVELLQRLRNGAKAAPYESEMRHSNGLLVPMLISLSSINDESGQMIGSSMIARDISERKRVERALHKRLRQLDLLTQAAQVLIMAEPGATPMQHELFDRVRLAMGGEIYLNYAISADPNHLRLESEHGLSEAMRARLSVAALDDSLCGIAAARRSPLIIENMQASDLPQARILQIEGVRSFAAFPLLAHGEVHGVAAFASTTRDRFRDGDLQVIQTVCDQVSAMLERGKLVEELHTREESLKVADRRKDDFIATLAHELRNPLAPIRNAIGILRQSTMPDPQLAWCRDVIERQVTQMTLLLEDLLDVSRVTRNKIELRREKIELQRVVEDAVETTRPLIDAQRHQLVLELPAQPIVVYGDLTRLTQVVGNLLNNAAKYTDVGGKIELVVRREGDEASIVVRDNGIGIEPQQAACIFDMFAQLTPALERSRGGLGIGLSLARGLVELHGGRIEARSEGTGRGSEFTVHLPIVHQAADSAPLRQAQPSFDVGARAGRRVLVVDDNADAAQTLATMLILSGLDTRLAFGGKEGMRIAEEWRPDAAVIDIGMPQFNGYELCRRIREQPWGDRMLLIACTGWGQNEDRQRARVAGFDVHLVKPIQPDEVLRIVSAGIVGEPAFD